MHALTLCPYRPLPYSSVTLMIVGSTDMFIARAIYSVPSSTYERVTAFANRDQRVPGQEINGKPSLTNDQAADRISLRGQERWPDRDADGKTALSYSFAKSAGATFTEAELLGFSEFNVKQKAQMRRSLQSWSDVADVTFTEKENDGTGDGHLRFGNFKDIKGVAAPNGKALTIYDPQRHEQNAWFRTGGYDAHLAPKVGSEGRNTFAHEVGHQIGLNHPGNYGGPSRGYAQDAEYAQDTAAHSLMSYWPETHSGQNFEKKGKRYFASSPQMDDIVAAQQLYGVNRNTRKDNTIYGFCSNTERDYYTVRSARKPMVASIWDGGGHDTLNLSGYHDDQQINLNAGTFSDVAGLKGNVSIAPGVVIEDAIGGFGNDLVLGNQASNNLVGGPGDDVIDGGAGQDRLWGCSGKDTFVFSHASHSTVAAPDIIMDFHSAEDVIDVSSIRVASGKPTLSFVNAFTGQSGQIRLGYNPKTHLSTLEIDLRARGMADFKVIIRGKVSRRDIIV